MVEMFIERIPDRNPRVETVEEVPMQTTTRNQSAPEGLSSRLRQWRSQLRTWACSAKFGYACSIILVGGLLVLEKLDDFFPNAPLFTGAPFALVSIFTALLWGIGPALLSFILGVVALVLFVSPSPLPLNVLSNVIVFTPFLLLQLIAIIVIVGLERSRRGLLEAHRQLQLLNQQLSQAMQLKDFIIMRAAHELRTPLTTILGRTQLFSARLRKVGATSTTLKDLPAYLNVVEARSHHLQSLIESLLLLSNVRTEPVGSYAQPCDLRQLSLEMIERQRKLSGRSIEFDCPTDEIMVPVDRQRLSQVFENLLGNAIKYSPADSPVLVQVSSDPSEVTLRVHNEGASLSPEQIAHLFDPFYRTSEVEYSSIPGWGLGLAISKEIVERWGGQIRVESSETSGITFVITFPVSCLVQSQS